MLQKASALQSSVLQLLDSKLDLVRTDILPSAGVEMLMVDKSSCSTAWLAAEKKYFSSA